MTLLHKLFGKNKRSLSWTVPPGTSMLFGQPAKLPLGVIAGTQEFLKDSRSVEDIYFCLCSMDGTNFTYLLVIDPKQRLSDEAFKHLVGELGKGAGKYGSDRPIDVMEMTDLMRGRVASGALVSIRNHPQVIAA